MNNNNETKLCKYCRSDIDKHAVYCPNCRKQQGKIAKCPFCHTEILTSDKVKCPNCGKNSKHFNLIVFFVICAFIAIIAGMSNNSKHTNLNNNNSTANTDVMRIMNVNEEQAKEICNILNSVGVSNINAIARADELDDYYWNGGSDKGYRLAYSGTDTNDMHRTVIVNINENGNVLAIKMASLNGVVLYEDGKILDNLKNYVMTDDDRANYKVMADNLMLNVLKAPSTAKFGSISEYKFGKDKGIVTVQGYVDSQNSFGATVRGEFQVKFNGSTAISLIFEGKEYIK